MRKLRVRMKVREVDFGKASGSAMMLVRMLFLELVNECCGCVDIAPGTLAFLSR